MRTLTEGEKVLVMLPTDNNKLLLRWKGPYIIKEKIGITDYRILMGNKLRLFHVNMLRKYTMREPIKCSMAAIIDTLDCPELVIEAEPSAMGRRSTTLTCRQTLMNLMLVRCDNCWVRILIYSLTGPVLQTSQNTESH